MLRLLTKLMLLAIGLIGLKAALWGGIHTWRPKRSFRYEAAYKRDSLLWPIRQQVNTVFVGSSRTACSINPRQFDSLTHQRTHSFNHGLSGVLVPDTFDESERLIQMNGLGLQTLFFELSFPSPTLPVDPFDKEKPLAELTLAIDYFRGHSVGGNSFRQTIHMLDSFGERLLMLKNTIIVSAQSLNKPTDETYLMLPNGYRYFQKRPEADPPKATQGPEAEFTTQPDTVASAYRRRIQHLIGLCERKKISLYFVIPNHLMQAEKNTLPGIYAAIPPRYRFDMPSAHNSLARMGAEYSDDGMHLNRRGASLFTARFAARYNQLKATPPRPAAHPARFVSR